MMVKQRETNTKPWGTLQELLLVSAVHRHGTTTWDSVAMELHNRCSQSPSPSPSPSPQDCRNKFFDLKRRFLSHNHNHNHDDSTSFLPMLDELKKIRVEELRRDVQRRDLLILSLETKVKRLEEERDRSFKERPAAPDLDAHARNRALPPENRDSKTASGDDDSDDRENRSLDESNSTSKKDDVRRNGVVAVITESMKITNKETGPLRTAAEPGREWSFNGAVEVEPESDSLQQHKRREKETNWAKAASQAGGVGDSNDAWESVSESKQEGKEGGGGVSKQQSSDVQSSGSLSQRKRCRNSRSGGGDRGSSSGEEPEGDEVSPAKERASAVKSEPLLKFLEMIRSHRLGSAFERRLRSQESDRYKKLIREHIDLRTIHSRVVKCVYTDSIHRFFRDLLLLFNNAIIFFHKTSPECVAALKLRALVLKEIKDKLQNSPPIAVVKSKAKQDGDSLSNPSKSSTLVGCRKRDSPGLLSDAAAKKAEKNARDFEEKPRVDQSKAAVCSGVKIYEKGTWKKGMKERPRPTANSGPRSSRTTSKNNGEVKHEFGGNELSSHDGMEVRMEKKERVTKKKQGAVSFLKRMKQNSPSEVSDEDADVSEDDSLKEEEEEDPEEEVVVEEKKKKMKKQKEGRRERVTRSGGGGGRGGGRGENGRGKRGVGRPPKRAEPVTVKRQQREEVAGGSGGKPRKRARR